MLDLPMPADVLEKLLRESEQQRTIDLDHLAEVTWQHGLDTEAVEALIDALESNGRTIRMDPTIALRDELRQVLAAARAYTTRHKRRPTLQDLVAATSLQPNVVSRALLYGRTLSR